MRELSLEKRPLETYDVDELHELRLDVGRNIRVCTEEIERLVRYRDTPPTPPSDTLNSSTSGGIVQISKEQRALLRTLKENDPRRFEILESMSGQADDNVRLARESTQRKYEELQRQHEADLPGIPARLEALHRTLGDLQAQRDTIQALMDKKRGRV